MNNYCSIMDEEIADRQLCFFDIYSSTDVMAFGAINSHGFLFRFYALYRIPQCCFYTLKTYC